MTSPPPPRTTGSSRCFARDLKPSNILVPRSTHSRSSCTHVGNLAGFKSLEKSSDAIENNHGKNKTQKFYKTGNKLCHGIIQKTVSVRRNCLVFILSDGVIFLLRLVRECPSQKKTTPPSIHLWAGGSQTMKRVLGGGGAVWCSCVENAENTPIVNAFSSTTVCVAKPRRGGGARRVCLSANTACEIKICDFGMARGGQAEIDPPSDLPCFSHFSPCPISPLTDESFPPCRLSFFSPAISPSVFRLLLNRATPSFNTLFEQTVNCICPACPVSRDIKLWFSDMKSIGFLFHCIENLSLVVRCSNQ